MRKDRLLLQACAVITLALGFLSSCIRDEAPGMECDIEKMWVEGEDLEQYFYDANDMKRTVISTESDIDFSVRSVVLMPKQVAVHFALTPGATISPENGSVQDFSNGPVIYTVTAEDGTTTRTYRVGFKENSQTIINKLNSFENYEEVRYGSSEIFYHRFYELSGSGDKLTDVWASGNEGFCLSMLSRILGGQGATPEEFPTVSDPNGRTGRCVKLQTLSTGDMGKTTKRPIAAGNLFMGRFNITYAATNSLLATEMGIPFPDEPVRVTGYYKYKRGADFTGADSNVIPGRQDEADIYAVLYRNKDDNGNAVMLNGGDVLTSPYIVRKARVASLPETDEWTPFNMFFEGDTPIDKVLLENLGYNLALVFSSSKSGATFEGAVGSTLYIDDVVLSVK
ncbi:MAG: PCMD domain-containing protein [Prevotella sp.]|nr:PCMD domain-containing protein [Prevotella sp.]